MSETTVVGIVQAISGKDIKTKFGEKNVYDIKIDGCWYGGLWNNPKCKKGDEVELLSIETPPYGYKIKSGTLKVLRAGVGDTTSDTPQTTAAPSGTKRQSFGFPIAPTDRQMSIIIQSSLNRATEVVLATYNAQTSAQKQKVASHDLVQEILDVSEAFVDRASGMSLAQELLEEQKQRYAEYSKLFSGELDLPKDATNEN